VKLSLILPYHGRERIRGGSFFSVSGQEGGGGGGHIRPQRLTDMTPLLL